jgi:hypothetical protein
VAKEKKPMKKGTKIFLGVLVATLVVALCMGAVALYLIHEKNKPKFVAPEIDPIPSASELPADGAAGAAYLERLYAAMIDADDVEGAWHTDVHIGTMTTTLKEADAALLQYFAEQSAGAVSGLYPSASELVMSEADEKPAFALPAESVTDYSASQGVLDEEEKKDDTASYYLDFTCTPAAPDAAAVQAGEIYQKATQTLAPALTVESFDIKAQNETVSAHTDRISDDLLELKVTKDYVITATVRLTEDYKALSENGLVEVEFPYQTVQTINFSHYGLRFLQKQMAVREDDLKALPMEVTVHSTATEADYKMTYDISDPEALSVDTDGVMDVHAAREEAVTITATLEYDVHSYQDTITVYVTELELEEETDA